MPPTYYLGLCAVAKDETPFLREWAGYHHFIGFEKIYVYDNDSLRPVRDTLAEFYDLGVCDTYTLQGEAVQLTAYNHCLRHHGDEFEWLAFFDIDEFLCLKQDDDARVLLRNYENYSALSINWDTFGSSGHINLPKGLVIKNFTQSLGYNENCKCIVRPAKVTMPFTSHHFIYSDGIAVNADYLPAYGAYAPLAVDKVCLNHYQFRSQYNYEQKINRGDATYGTYNPRSLEAFHRQAYAETEERTDMLPLVDAVETMSANNTWRKKYNIAFADIVDKPLLEILMLINTCIAAGNLATAEVVFSLAYKIFRKDLNFMLMGISLLRKAERFPRALAVAEETAQTHPAPAAYVALYECLIAAGGHEAGRAVRNFLKFIVRHEKDAENKRILEDALKRHP
jgi:hypothetical protein